MLNLLKNIISINLRLILKDQHMSQAELSRLTGISTSTVNDYVKGKTFISPKNISKIMTALNIEEADLITYNTTKHNEHTVLSINENNQFVASFPYSLITLDTDLVVNHKTFHKYDCLLLEQKDFYAENDLVYLANSQTIAPFSHMQSSEIIGKVIAHFSLFQ